MYNTIIVVFIAVISVFSQTIQMDGNDIKSFESEFKWLEGEWIHKDAKNIFIEKWKQNSASEFIGLGYKVKSVDTILIEEIRIVKTETGEYYIPTVQNQNDGLPIKFKLIDKVNGFTFENKKHDFPNYISYKPISIDSMKVELRGLNDSSSKITFYFKRLKN